MSSVRIRRLCLPLALIASAPVYGQQNMHNRQGRLRTIPAQEGHTDAKAV